MPKVFIKRASEVLIAFGVLILLGALAILIKTSYEDANADEHARQTVEQLRENIYEQPNSSISGTESVDNHKDLAEKNNINKSSGQSSSKEAVVVIDGTGYLGYLSFTGYGKVLPVLADWSFENLQYAPARFSGSVIDNNLVIAAHNYFSHFYLLNEMTEGNEVILTLPDGKEIHYIVDKIERLSPTELDKLTAGDYDLTLFTCTPTGLARTTVRCNKI